MSQFDFIVRSPANGDAISTGAIEHDDVFKGAMQGGEPELTAFFHGLPEVTEVPTGQQVDARVYTQDEPAQEVWAHTWDAD